MKGAEYCHFIKQSSRNLDGNSDPSDPGGKIDPPRSVVPMAVELMFHELGAVQVETKINGVTSKTTGQTSINLGGDLPTFLEWAVGKP